MNRIARLAIAAATLAPWATPLTAHAAEVLNREYRQQGRISQGVESGQMTANETARVERREANINASRRADLAANGGHLTPGEYRRLNARENSVSNQIYRDKHNLATQPGVIPQ